MTRQAIVAQIRGRTLVPAPLKPSWSFLEHVVALGDEEAAEGRPALACAWYKFACEHVPRMPGAVADVFELFLARAAVWPDADSVGAQRYRAALAVAIGGRNTARC